MEKFEWGKNTILSKLKAQKGSGAKSNQIKALSQMLDKLGFKSIVNSKVSSANAASMAIKGNKAIISYLSKSGIKPYLFHVADPKRLAGIQQMVLNAMKSNQKPGGQSKSRMQQTLNALGMYNMGGNHKDPDRIKQMKEFGISYKGEANNFLSKLGVNMEEIHSIKEETSDMPKKERKPKDNASNKEEGMNADQAIAKIRETVAKGRKVFKKPWMVSKDLAIDIAENKQASKDFNVKLNAEGRRQLKLMSYKREQTKKGVKVGTALLSGFADNLQKAWEKSYRG